MLLINGKMPFRLFKKEGVIFAAGVLCGFFVRSMMAKSDPQSAKLTAQDPGNIAAEKYVEMVKTQIERGEERPNASVLIDNMEIAPECFMKVPEIIKHAGYPFEEHTVATTDGYKLVMHRIPYGKDGGVNKNGSSNPTGPVVFIQHGLLADSANWVSNGPRNSLAFLLADYGFDVWLGNVRGNTYSRKHVILDPNKDEKFWRYSWQQFSEFDLPAMVDYALQKAGKEKLYYVGHSQGTLIMFARLAEDDQFNDKVHVFIALGPVFNLNGFKSPLKHLAQFYNTLEMGQWMMGGAELLPNSEAGKWLASKIHGLMSNDANARYHGENVLLNIAGFSPKRYCLDRIPVYLAHLPAGTSIQNIIHYAQMITNKETRKYRFDTEEENKKAYGTSTPPGYDLRRIRTPVAMYWGSDDWFADRDDVLAILPQLKTLIKTKEMKDWDHLEFLYGAEAADTLYREIAEMIKENENKSFKEKMTRSDL